MNADVNRAGWGACRGLAASSLVIALLLGLAAAGCSSQGRVGANSGQGQHEAGARLELNEGKKWVVASPMMAYLRALERAVQDFEAGPEQDHAALAAQVQKNLEQLVTHCTMEGKAHDELHKWLLPFVGLSVEYSKAAAPELQRAKLAEMKQSLKVFNAFFE